MITIIEKPSRRARGLTTLSLRQRAFLRASAKDLKELRMMRILALKDQIADENYAISAETIAEALIRETVIDAVATAITQEEKVSDKRAAKEFSSRSRVSRYARITVERSNSSKHALWYVVGWATDHQRYTLAVSLRRDIAEDLCQKMMRRRTA